MTMLKYKGYVGRVEFDPDAMIFHGDVINTRDVITFQGSTPEEIKTAFIGSVEDYLNFCAERGEQPEKPFSGKLQLRMGADLHRNVTFLAASEKKSINTVVMEAIANFITAKTLVPIAGVKEVKKSRLRVTAQARPLSRDEVKGKRPKTRKRPIGG